MQSPRVDGLVDAVVIGAGVAGSVAAFLVAQAGHSVVLVERSDWPRDKACGCCLNAAALGILDRCGLGSAARASGVVTSTLEVRTARGRVGLSGADGVAIRRSVLDAALVEGARAAGVWFASSTHAEVHGDAVEVSEQTRDPRCVVMLRSPAGEKSIVRPRVVIVADGLGGRSLDRFVSMRPVVSRQSRMGVGLLVDRERAPIAAGVVWMHLGRKGYVGLVSLGDGLTDCAAAVDACWMREIGGPLAAIRAILRETGAEFGDEIAAASGTRLIGTPLLTRRRACVALPGVVVVGDAAGYVEPFTGEGMAWALEAVAELAPRVDGALRAWSGETPRALAADWNRRCAMLRARQQRLSRGVRWVTRWPVATNACVMALGVGRIGRFAVEAIGRSRLESHAALDGVR